MTFGGFSDNRQPAPMAEINVTPMVDVMLVLLVIFILAAPLFTHAVKLELPGVAAAPVTLQPSTIVLSIDAAGIIYWNDEVVAPEALPARMASAATQNSPPDLQLRADRATRYEVIAKVMAAAQAKGLTKIGFVTDPQATMPTTDALPVPAQAQPRQLQLSPALTPLSGR